MKRLATYAVLSGWSLVCAFPLYWVALTSIKSENDIARGTGWLPFVDFTPSFRAWRFLFLDHNESLVSSLVNSVLVATSSTLICVSIATLLIYALTRLMAPTSRVSSLIQNCVFACRLLSPVVLALPLYVMLNLAMLNDTRTALSLVYATINLPVAYWLLRPAFGKRATEQEESAELEGASRSRVLFDILLPMIASSVAAISLLVFVLAWNEYLLAAFLTTDKAMTLPVWMVGQLSYKEAQIAGEAEEWANMSAAAVVMATPLVFATYWAMRAVAAAAQR